MARTKAISLIQSGSTKVDLAELSGLVISNIQKDTLSQGLKSQAYTGNPASGSVEFKRFKNSASQPYGSLEREYGANFSKIFRTITVDNGSEFSDCAGMEKSCRRKGNRTKIYYCHPYSLYERGSNENVNKMIRRWFPKGTDFRKVTAKAIQKVEDWINNYPREILGFRTAEAVFQEGVACLI